MKWKRLLILNLSLLAYLAPAAQILTPVQGTVEWKPISGTEAELQIHLSIEEGWHVYSTHMPEGGPISAELRWNESEGITPLGELKGRGEELKKFDDLFGMDVRYYKGEVIFVQRVRYKGESYAVAGSLTYGACNDETCIPPTKIPFSFSGEVPKEEVPPAEPDALQQKDTTTATGTPSPQEADSLITPPAIQAHTPEGLPDYWTPVIDELRSFGGDAGRVSHSLFYVFLAGFLGGLLALLTPCVWPIIPLTVSFFLKRSSDRRRGIRDAILYGCAIFSIYLLLGLAVTLFYGATALNELSTNAVFNSVCFLLLVVFGVSFLGYFDLQLPASWSDRLNKRAEHAGGIVAIFLMAFTLVVVSFSCTGPIIGFLLVEVSSQGAMLGPALGMGGFALALALPFTLFALFPSWMKSMPKSGSWMNRVKVILAFIEFGFALKFLSVADLAYGWGLLSRTTFIVLWMILALGLWLYLLGLLRFPHDSKGDQSRKVQIAGTLILLPFLIYLGSGLYGKPLHAISGFLPPAEQVSSGAQGTHFKDYDEGMRYAREQGLPLLVDFTGHGCVNCRKMEATIWPDPHVQELMGQYVLVSLYVDERQALPAPLSVTENGQPLLLETVGEKWSYLQRMKFGANAQPFYVLVDTNGQPLTASQGFTESISAFEAFLTQGLKAFQKQ